MYYPNDIEEICYEEEHIKKVLEEIKINFNRYFDNYISTEAGVRITEKSFKDISDNLGLEERVLQKNIDKKNSFIKIIKASIKDFEKDRKKYLELMDIEILEEHEEDPDNFKNTALKNECPIIRMTLQNKKAKELDKYRAEFRRSNPNELLNVVANLANFVNEYNEKIYDKNNYEEMTSLDQLNTSDLDTDDYVVYGVIGGGIKSHLIYKTNPSIFANRSREVLWAFWYLTDKKTFGCVEDSEFLNINVKKLTTQQNFFYPYELFSFYAYNIYLLLKRKAEENGVYIDEDYRYVIVDSFLSFVAKQHSDEINFLQSQAREDGYAYY